MKPKPLHGFTPADLRAFGEGRKTQWRMPVKVQPPADIDHLHGLQFADRAPYELEDDETGLIYGFGFASEDRAWKCPLGKPGDRLFITEPFRIESFGAGVAQIRYEADNVRGNNAGVSDRCLPGKCGRVSARRMPAHCARYWCEIVAVRVERVAAISEADAMAEGVEPGCLTCGENCIYSGGCGFCRPAYRDSFINLWNARHGAGAWESNSWVWVLELKKVEGAK